MSGAQGETAFDESVFDQPDADAAVITADKAPAGDAGTEPAAKADPRSQITEAAKKNGWAGKEDWKGDEADWLDAPEFILKAVGEVLPSMRQALDDAKGEVKDLKAAVRESVKHLTKARQDGYEQRSRELQDELARSTEANDIAAVRAVTKDIVALEREVRDEPAEDDAPEPLPEFLSWKEENPWFGKDAAMTAAASALGEEVLAEGYTGKAQIKETDRRLREKFPGLYAKPTNPNRALPGSVEGAGQARRQGGKSFSDMPREHQEMCLDMMKRTKSITKENYAREFFAEEKQ